MKEDHGNWYWYDNMIEGLASDEHKTLYKAGDLVVVRPDLKAYERYGMENSGVVDTATSAMVKFAGKVVKIEKFDAHNSKEYFINADDGAWFWTDGMFLGKVENVIKPGVKVKIVADDSILGKYGLPGFNVENKVYTVEKTEHCSFCKVRVFCVEESSLHFGFDCISEIVEEKSTFKDDGEVVLDQAISDGTCSTGPEKEPKKAEKPERFKPVDTIVILSDGDTTKAYRKLGGKIIEEVEISRYYTDKHDIHVAAQECIKKMTGPKFYTGKVHCVLSHVDWWESGKTYEVVDGCVIAEDGDKYGPIKDFDHLREILNLCIWREVK